MALPAFDSSSAEILVLNSVNSEELGLINLASESSVAEVS